MARPLYPADTGGRIRSSQIFERLSKIHDITVLCFRTPDDTDEPFERMRQCCSHLETVDWRETEKFTPRFYAELAAGLFSPLPYTAWKYRSAAMTARIEAHLAEGRYDLLLCDFLQPSVNCVDVRFRPKLLFEHNVEARIRARQIEYATNPLSRWYLRHEAARLRRFEARAAAAFDHCIMVSDEDCRVMATDYGARNTSAIPTGVDAAVFQPLGRESAQPSIVFVGSMDWLPNQDAVRYLAEQILPQIRREQPVTLTVVGRNPPASIRALAGDDVQVTGTVDDVRPFVGSAHVCVVPIRIGGGTRIKIFEAMAMGRAVVSTTVGAEGLPVTHGQDILIADDAAGFAESVLRLLRDTGLRRRLGEAARQLVTRHYTSERAAQAFSDTCVRVVEQVRTEQR